jgi:O-antigen/teichoic acid export membrane protein
MPFCFGLAATAEPLVLTVLGPKWVQAVPLVALLALAMPFMTLQLLFGPASYALGRAKLAVWVGAIGALLMPAAFLIGIRFGIYGMAYAWLLAMPLFAAATAALSLPMLQLKPTELGRAVAPAALAAAAMAVGVLGLDWLLPPLATHVRLAVLVASGAGLYAVLLAAFARPIVDELIALLPRRARAASPA